MRVVNTGNTFKIYDNSLQTFNSLPAQAYVVRFDKMSGFFLEKYSDIAVTEKVYGVHREKVDKVMSSFRLFGRNLGVILSGAKGIGKSLCAKMLAQRAVEEGYPLIVVNTYIPGIADYLTSIEQEVVILFDEFDKTFSSGSRDNMNDPQSEMLTLFDGLSQGKKMFVVTCNELNNLNNYLVNRPGRFHYHFRFDYPTSEEIREYLQDKISEQYYKEIDKVIAFSRKIELNYDCLRAIGFELSCGLSFENAIKDLNIINLSREKYTLMLFFKDGTKVNLRECYVDMFDDNEICIEMTDAKGYDFYVNFNPCDSVYAYEKGGTIIQADAITIDWQDSYYSDDEKDRAALAGRKQREVDYLLIRKKMAKNIHYAV